MTTLRERIRPPASATIGSHVDLRSNALNLVRLVLASAVIVWHSYTVTGHPLENTGPLQLLSDLPVDGFFAISGFLLTASLLRKPALLAYLRNRALRLIPAYWTSLVLVALVAAPVSQLMQSRDAGAVFSGPHSALHYVLDNLALKVQYYDVAGTPTGVPFPGVWNGSAWTLVWEAYAYLGLAAAALLTLLRRPGVMLAITAVAWAVMTADSYELIKHNFYLGTGGRLGFMFLCGATLYLYRDRIPTGRWPLALAALLVVGSTALRDYRILAGPALAYLVVWIGGAIRDRRWHLAKVDISYGMYIYAFPVQQLLVLAGLVSLPPLLFAVVAACATVPLALASWFVVERPALRLKSVPRRMRRRGSATPSLDAEIADVVANDLCTGCGLCSQLRDDIVMTLDGAGFRRPHARGGVHLDPVAEEDAVRRFRASCPGRIVAAPRPVVPFARNATFGPYVTAWQGWAADPHVRHAGSSGGVLTALSAWLLERGDAASVIGAAQSVERPNETAPQRFGTPEDVLRGAGSRYAPVSNLELVATAADAVVAKPCEAAALRADANGTHPILLTFFCAGVPSQLATDRLAEKLVGGPIPLAAVRYRGNGWPGDFAVRTVAGDERACSYEQSWGEHLGRQVQWRCKLCVDGTGAAADIAVGDYWHATRGGFPVFDDAPGRSIVLARTPRGHEIVLAAAAAGVIELADVDVAAAERAQPSQVERRRTLWGRLLGTRLAGRGVPSYPGWALWRAAVRHPRANLVAARRAYGRARRRP